MTFIRSFLKTWRTTTLAALIELRTSFWVIPLVISAAGFVLAALTISIDVFVAPRGFLPEYVPVISASSARTMIAMFAGSLVSAVTVIFSLTMVALTMASSQFGPRVITGFLESQRSQRAVGVIFAAFVYCVSVLWMIGADEAQAVPLVSVNGSLVAMLVALGTMLSFIQYVSHSIQVGTMIQHISDDMDADLAKVIGTRTGDEPNQVGPAPTGGAVVRSRTTGYLRFIRVGTLRDLATQHDLELVVQLPVGSFVMEGTPLIAVSPAIGVHPGVSEDILAAISIGATRSYDQDALYRAHELLDIALRALSPGINDPRTAVTCIDRIGSAILRFAKCGEGSGVALDDSGAGRVWLPVLTFSTFVESVLAPIVDAGHDQIIVALHVQLLLGRIAEQCDDPDYLAVLARQADRAFAVAKASLRDEVMVAQLAEKYRRTLAIAMRTL